MKIKDKREQLGISQKELASRCEIAQSTLCDIEQGRSKASIDTALKIAKALDVDDIKFFEEEQRGNAYKRTGVIRRTCKSAGTKGTSRHHY